MPTTSVQLSDREERLLSSLVLYGIGKSKGDILRSGLENFFNDLPSETRKKISNLVDDVENTIR